MKRIIVTIATAVLFLTLASTALGAPPAIGNAQPWTTIPKPVAYGYVGAVYVGPVSACASNTANGGGPSLCVDTTRRYAPLYRRTSRFKWKIDRISNATGKVLFTAPYGKGWQWVWAPTVGFGVMRAHDLYEFGPIS